jgi:hypothetical protein
MDVSDAQSPKLRLSSAASEQIRDKSPEWVSSPQENTKSRPTSQSRSEAASIAKTNITNTDMASTPTAQPGFTTAHGTTSQAFQAAENAAALSQAENNIQVDTFSSESEREHAGSSSDYDTDSMLSADGHEEGSTTSFSFENGRRYHGFRKGIYNFPNDDTEQDREDMKHAMMMRLCQRLFFAPIVEDPHQILDMGTGTGIWAIDGESGYTR